MGVLGIIVAVPLQSLGGAGILIDSDCMLRRAAELLVAILLLLLRSNVIVSLNRN